MPDPTSPLNKTSPSAPSSDDAAIFVMPEKFRGGGRGKKSVQPKKTGRLTLIIGLAVLAVFVIAAAAVYISLGLERQPAANVAQNANTAVENNENAARVSDTSANANLPLNEAIASPSVPAEPPPVVEETPAVSVSAERFPLSLDIDGDGISDIEEGLYNTNASVADTDGDGYPDGLEVRNLYNPAGVAPVRLLDSGLVNFYDNTVLGYRIFYPRVWTVRPLDATQKETLFTANTGEFIQVIAQENPEELTAVQWYAEQVPGIDFAALEKIDTDVFQGVKSGNGLNAYINSKNGKRDVLYILAYNVGTRTEANFLATFDMMLQSFR